MEKISVIIIGCSLATACTSGTVKTTQAKRPNIIFILTDDQRWDALGYAGNSIIQTPELDRLAGEGTWLRDITG